MKTTWPDPRPDSFPGSVEALTSGEQHPCTAADSLSQWDQPHPHRLRGRAHQRKAKFPQQDTQYLGIVFTDTTGRRHVHITTSEYPQQKSDSSRNLMQSRVQTRSDMAGEGKSCMTTEKAFSPSRAEDFTPFRTASQSFTGEGRFKAAGFSISRIQVSPILEGEAR